MAKHGKTKKKVENRGKIEKQRKKEITWETWEDVCKQGNKQRKTEKNTGKHRKTGETIENKQRKAGNNMRILKKHGKHRKAWENRRKQGKR